VTEQKLKVRDVAEFEGDIILTLQGHSGKYDAVYVAEAKNGLIAIGGSGNEAFFNLGMAYRNAGLFNEEKSESVKEAK
jgi:hypothetical protein